MLVVKRRPRTSPIRDAEDTASQKRIANLLVDATSEFLAGLERLGPTLLDAVLHRSSTYTADLIDFSPFEDVVAPLADELRVEVLDSAARTRKRIPRVLRVQKQEGVLFGNLQNTDKLAETWAFQHALDMVQGGWLPAPTQAAIQQFGLYPAKTLTNSAIESLVFGEGKIRWKYPDGTFSPERPLTTSTLASWMTNWITLKPGSPQMKAHDKMAAATLFRVDTGELSEQKALQMIERDRQRRVKQRALTIARTESARATHQGRQMAWENAMQNGQIAEDTRIMWFTNIDGKACEECLALNGTIVDGINSDNFPDGPPPVHPNCRCDVLLISGNWSPQETLAALAASDDVIQDLMNQMDVAGEFPQTLGGAPPPSTATAPTTAPPVGTGTTAVAPKDQPPYQPGFGDDALAFMDYSSGPRWGAKTFSDAVRRARTAVKNSIRKYTGSLHKPLNTFLRRGRTGAPFNGYGGSVTAQTLRDHEKKIREGLSLQTPDTFIAVRGLSGSAHNEAVWGNIQAGDLYFDRGFASTSLAPTPALGGATYVRMRIPKGTQGAYVAAVSEYGSGEQEYMLQQGTLFRVVAVHQPRPGSSRRYVDVEVVGQYPGAMEPPDSVLFGQPGTLFKAKAAAWRTDRLNDHPVKSRIAADGFIEELGQKFVSDPDELLLYRPNLDGKYERLA